MKKIILLFTLIALILPIIAFGSIASRYGGVSIASVAYHASHTMELQTQYCALSPSYPLTNCDTPVVWNYPLSAGQSQTSWSSLTWEKGEVLVLLKVTLRDSSGKVISETRFNDPNKASVCMAKTRDGGKALTQNIILLNEIVRGGNPAGDKILVVCEPTATSEATDYEMYEDVAPHRAVLENFPNSILSAVSG